MIKKLTGFILSVIMIFTMCSMVSADVADLPEKTADTNRYYFYLPDSWLNSSTELTGNTAGIYWWNGTDAQNWLPGVSAHKADTDGVYYYDVPTDVTTIIWNNYVDGGADIHSPFYADAISTKNVVADCYKAGDSEFYPDGIECFDGMIFVTDYAKMHRNDYSGKMQFDGEWFYYYGNGEYGTSAVRGESEIYTEQAWNMPHEPEITTPDEPEVTTPDEPEVTTPDEPEVTTPDEPEVTTPDEPEVICIIGDTDSDSKISVKDATFIQKAVAGLVTLNEIAKFSADVDANGTINVKDATAIQKWLVDIPVNMPIGETTAYKAG